MHNQSHTPQPWVCICIENHITFLFFFLLRTQKSQTNKTHSKIGSCTAYFVPVMVQFRSVLSDLDLAAHNPSCGSDPTPTRLGLELRIILTHLKHKRQNFHTLPSKCKIGLIKITDLGFKKTNRAAKRPTFKPELTYQGCRQ